MGSCTAGGAYVPAMSDETIIVKNQGTIFLGGPPLVKAATGEVVSAEDLGGGDVHTRLSGVADHLAQNDMHALALARAGRGHPEPRARLPPVQLREPRPPKYDAAGAVRRDPDRHAQALRRARDHRPHRRRLASSTSSRRASAPRWSAASPTSKACRSASSPTTASCSRESAQKGAHFIELCCQRKVPLVFLQNITGFMVGPQVRERRHRPPRRQDGDGGGHGQRAQVHRHHRRQLRRRQLRHVRPRLLAALPVDVAERAHLA